MYRSLRNLSYIYTAGLVLTMLATTATLAQSIGGISVEKLSSSPTNLGKTDITRIFDDPNFFNSAVNAAWPAAKPAADKAVEQGIAGNNPKFPKGITIYYQHSNLAGQGVVQSQLNGNMLTLIFVLNGNNLEAHCTTPTPLGQYADPKFTVFYDLEIGARVPIPSLTQPLRVESVVAKIQNSRLESHNVSADVLNTVNSVVKFLSGQDFKATIESKINRETSYTKQINDALAPINQTLQRLVQQGYTSLGALLNGAPMLGLRPRGVSPSSMSAKLVLRASPPKTPISVVINRVSNNGKDQNFDPRTQGPYGDVVKVKIFDQAYVSGDPSGHVFSSGVLADARGIPISLEVERTHFQPNLVPLGTPDAYGKVPMGPDPRGAGKVVTSVLSVASLIYNPITGQITGNKAAGGAVTGVAGSEMSIPGSGTYYPGIAFTISDAKHPVNRSRISRTVSHH